MIGINARDLSTFEIDRSAQLELVARAPRDRIVIAESGVHTRAQGAAAELAGADAILVGSALMQRRRPAGEAARAALAAAREGVRTDAAGGRRRRRSRRAPTCSASSSPSESPRRAAAVLDVPDTALSVAVFVEDTEETPPTSFSSIRDDGGSVRGREAMLLREGRQVARVLDQPWQEHDPAHWSAAAATEGRVMLAGGLGPENVRDAIAAVRPVGASTRRRRSRRSPASRITRACAPSSRRRGHERRRRSAPTAGATSPRR